MIQPQDKRKPERIAVLLAPDIAARLKRYAEELSSDLDYTAGAIIAEHLSKLKPERSTEPERPMERKKRGPKQREQTALQELPPVEKDVA